MNLFRDLFTVTDDFIIQFLDVKAFLELLLVLNQTCSTIQSHTTIVTDDTATTVCIRQTGDDSRPTGRQHLLRIGRKHSFVVRLTVFRENLFRHRVEMVAVSFQAVFHHADTAFRKNTTLERGIRLQSHNHFIILIYITRPVSRDALGEFCFGVIHTLLTLHLEHLGQFVPHFAGLLRRRLQERIIPRVRSIIVLNEITHVDFLLPQFAFEAGPAFVVTFHNLSVLVIYVLTGCKDTEK